MQEQCLLKFERRDLVMWMRTVHSSQCNDCISEEAIDMLAAEGTVESLGDIIVLEN
ncbi:hypothetical protein KKH39_03425 [Patescibacteria group bacterium]|nr:hypothetical protein [Patescibacteria group bacterium]